MLQMCRELGFRVERDPEDNSVDLVTLDLSSSAVQKLTQ
jgi:hypothetical protein